MILGVVAAAFLLSTLYTPDSSQEIQYSDLLGKVAANQVKDITWNNTDGSITGQLNDAAGTKFHTNGPITPSDADRQLLSEHNVAVKFSTPQSSIWPTLLTFILPVALLIGFFVWMQRRAQSQMGGIMSIGRSRAEHLLDRAARHDLRRRRRLRGRQAGDP